MLLLLLLLLPLLPLLPAAADTINRVTVHTDTVTHQITPLAMGCHSDTGYEHQARGFYAQMIVPDSMNATSFTATPHWGGNASTDGSFSSARVGWNVETSAPSVAFTHSTKTDEASRFHGVASERLSLAGKGSGGLSNRGLGNAGMVFEGGKPYEGFLWAAAASASPVLVVVSLEDYTATPKRVLATQTLKVQAGPGFKRYNFTLTPSASTRCIDIPYRSDPLILCGSHSANVSPRSFAADEKLGHICVRCGGQFVVSLSVPGAVLVNYAYLQPGQWGRVMTRVPGGLPVLASAAATLKAMGVKAIRQGGSFASSPSARGDPTYYQWQKWSGPAWSRPSRVDGTWGLDLLSGWGPFEMIDLCNALGIEPVITTSATSSAQDFADLVEYCWGNASTAMGKKRLADGHSERYRVKYFELGNEQYNEHYVEQVAAMEEKARELGIGKTLFYMFPQKSFLNATDIKKAAALSPRVDSQMLADIHIDAGGAVGVAETLFQSPNLTAAGLRIGAVNAETNAQTHTFVRAMSEAADLNDWFNAPLASAADGGGGGGGGGGNRLHFRAASFCMASSNDFDDWDQGMSFFLPNMTWLQPPGYVHQMIDQTWQPDALKVEVGRNNGSGTQPPLHPPNSLFSAQKSADGRTLVLRYVNFHQPSDSRPPPLAPATTLTVHLLGSMAAAEFDNATMWTLAAADPDSGNTPAQPTRVAPQKSLLPVLRDGVVLSIPANSYVIVVATLPGGAANLI